MKKRLVRAPAQAPPNYSKKEEKERIEEIYPIKAPEQKTSESKNHKAAETFHRKNGKLHVEKPRRQKTDVAVATTK